MNQKKKIVFLASDCESSRWVYNALKDQYAFVGIILENPIAKSTLIKKRIKKIGILKVIGQVLFSMLLVPILKWQAKNRRAALIENYHLDSSPFPTEAIRTDSINSELSKASLINLQPDFVLVNGTRIISQNILGCCNARFINMHVGITPWYRGSHGGYWALRNNDLNNFGTTLHLVDKGVDTGAVIRQAFIQPTKADNFTSYPILQTAIGIQALKELYPDLLLNNFTIVQHKEKGKMYYQPGFLDYLFTKHKIKTPIH
ncbi:MAG: formyl transferase [Chitinophagaceae bacterium]